MSALPEDLVSDEEEEVLPCSGFRVKYLGCATFGVRKKRLPKGISSMQRPLLDVYTSARKRGESQRSSHLLALDQRLDVLEYGLVLAQRGNSSREREGRGDEDLVLIKVLTPLTNAVLWAAVRFQARALRRRVLGAAFVPLACCDAVLDRKGFLRLDAKHRFLVSLSHPSVFACVFRKVSDPRSFECHAFACASAREALALGSALSVVRERSEMPPIARPPWPPPPRPPTHHNFLMEDRGSDRASSSQHMPGHPRMMRESEEESNSYASVHKFNKNIFGRNVCRSGGGPSSESSSGAKGRCQRSAGRREPIGGPTAARTELINHNRWTPVAKGAGPPPPPTPSPPPPPPPPPPPCSFPLPSPGNGRDHFSSGSAFSPSDTSCSAEYLDIRRRRRCGGGGGDGGRRDVWTMTEAEEEKTIDLSSESSISGGETNSSRLTETGWVPSAPPRTGSTASPVKYTYFGYETFRAPTWSPKRCSDERAMPPRRQQDGNRRDREKALLRTNLDHCTRRTGKTKTSSVSPATIVGNGTGRVTISVPFCKKGGSSHGGRSSVASSTQTDGSRSAVILLPPRGVRSFRSDRRVGDWSTLSQTTSEDGISVLQHRQPRGAIGSNGGASSTSSSSSSSASKPNHHCSRTRPRPQKMLRWRSEDRIPARKSFFYSLKRLSLQSLTKAKHKTGKLFSSMRTKLMGSRKSPDGSEDSAYDTSEVCLSPSGRNATNRSGYAEEGISAGGSGGTKARRQQSWSFHDLRTAVEKRSTTPSRRHRAGGSSGESKSGGAHSSLLLRKLQEKQPKRRTRRRHRRRRSSGSDSGVEEYYPSDASVLRRSGSDRTDSKRGITRVQVHHGMNEDAYHRWSHTNIQDELGYIP